eukprot:3941346-Rhodomonas_salina.2
MLVRALVCKLHVIGAATFTLSRHHSSPESLRLRRTIGGCYLASHVGLHRRHAWYHHTPISVPSIAHRGRRQIAQRRTMWRWHHQTAWEERMLYQYRTSCSKLKRVCQYRTSRSKRVGSSSSPGGTGIGYWPYVGLNRSAGFAIRYVSTGLRVARAPRHGIARCSRMCTWGRSKLELWVGGRPMCGPLLRRLLGAPYHVSVLRGAWHARRQIATQYWTLHSTIHSPPAP